MWILLMGCCCCWVLDSKCLETSSNFFDGRKVGGWQRQERWKGNVSAPLLKVFLYYGCGLSSLSRVLCLTDTPRSSWVAGGRAAQMDLLKDHLLSPIPPLSSSCLCFTEAFGWTLRVPPLLWCATCCCYPSRDAFGVLLDIQHALYLWRNFWSSAEKIQEWEGHSQKLLYMPCEK